MSVSRIGPVGAVLGGLVWVVAESFPGARKKSTRRRNVAGLALLVVAFAALGYSLVATAPVWLRVVVTIATPLLGVMVWLTCASSLPSDDVSAMVGGVLLSSAAGSAWDAAGARSRPRSPSRRRAAAVPPADGGGSGYRSRGCCGWAHVGIGRLT